MQHGTPTSALFVLCSPPSLADLYLNHLCSCYVPHRHLADNIRDFFHNWRYHQCWSDHLHNDHLGERRLHHSRKALDFHRLSGASDSPSCVCVYVKVTHEVALSLMHASFTQLLQRAVLTIRFYISTFLLLCCAVQWVLFFSQIVIRAMIPDVPRFVIIQKARTEFLVSKMIDKVSDEGDEDVIKCALNQKVLTVGSIHESAPGV